MECRETCDIETRDLGEKPLLGIGLWKPILRTGLVKKTYPEDRFNGITNGIDMSKNTTIFTLLNFATYGYEG